MAQACAAQGFSQACLNFSRCKSHRQVLELFVVQGEDDEIQVAKGWPWEVRKSRVGKCLRQLSLALTTPATEDDSIPILDLPQVGSVSSNGLPVSEAPSVVSALLSGALLNCAFLGVLRFFQVALASGDAAFARTLLTLLGFVSIAVATAFLFGQRDFKRLFAYSSVENMGILAVGVGLGGAAAYGAMLHAVNHSFAKAGLFLVAGNVLRRYGTTAAAGVRGALRGLPLSGPLLFALFLAVAGMPPRTPMMKE